ncbi:MAG: hypothetical protein WBY84_02420, partial [Pseudolabrys sp.]
CGLFYASFELCLHAGFHFDLCNLEDHGGTLSVVLAAALWVIGCPLQAVPQNARKRRSAQ